MLIVSLPPSISLDAVAWFPSISSPMQLFTKLFQLWAKKSYTSLAKRTRFAERTLAKVASVLVDRAFRAFGAFVLSCRAEWGLLITGHTKLPVGTKTTEIVIYELKSFKH